MTSESIFTLVSVNPDSFDLNVRVALPAIIWTTNAMPTQTNTINTGSQPSEIQISTKLKQFATGITKTIDMKIMVRSIEKRSEDIMEISLPEFVFCKLCELKCVTLSYMTAQRVLRILMAVIMPYMMYRLRPSSAIEFNARKIAISQIPLVYGYSLS
jgi:hypothetical protein